MEKYIILKYAKNVLDKNLSHFINNGWRELDIEIDNKNNFSEYNSIQHKA